MPDKVPAKVPLAFLESRFVFRDPLFAQWTANGEIVSAVYRAFQEWKINLENVSWKQNAANYGEIQVTFNLLNWKILFNVGLGAVTVSVNNPDWSEAAFISRIAKAGIDAVQASAKAAVEKQLITLSMHLQPQGRSVREITSKFVRLGGEGEKGEKVRAYGFSVYREDSYWVVDSSALYSEALFLKIFRTFGGTVPFEQMAGTLNKEENDVLELLELRLD